MHIILVSNRLATAKTFNVSWRMAFALVAVLAALSVVTALVFLRLGNASDDRVEATSVQTGASANVSDSSKSENYARENISSMAVKLGKMQAELMRLDSLGDRISKLTGLNMPKSETPAKGGQGGPLVHPSRPLAMDELQREIDHLANAVEQSSDALTALESQLMERRIKSSLLPTIVPVEPKRIGSVFGRRVDPIAGVTAMHEGIDFVADPGTPVIASAGGVVAVAEFHPEYGYLIEINHGNEFSSRYAHLSKMKVKPGQVVKRGQAIGLSGNTGRSTGPHLHFEVRFKEVAQNPERFLRQGTQLATASLAELKPIEQEASLPRASSRKSMTIKSVKEKR